VIDDPFVAHRSLLFTVAYAMLGSAADAEDVVQEAWLRWVTVDQGAVRDPRAYAVTIVTRKALDRLRALARQREEYVGEWLPEPLLTTPDVADDVELAESVSMAMLTVLETLAPVERVIFVLREVFATPYDEIAEAVGKTPAAVRQIAHRAREHVTARRPRTRVNRADHKAALDSFANAINTGDLQSLMDVLAPDVVSVNDGGGYVPASRKPIIGAEKLVALLAIGLRRAPSPLVCVPVWINGEPGVRVDLGDEVVAAISLTVEDGRITRIYSVWNPHKLARLDESATLTRI
jgi:RNA polymerase sigma-70 factor (TIGR02957 family)